MSIGERIAEERKRLKLTQAAFADKLRVSLSSQKRYETGERYPDSEYLNLARAIEVDVFYIFSGVKSEDRDMHDVAEIELRDGFYAALGFSHQDIRNLLVEMTKIVKKEVDEGGAWDTDVWISKRDKFISNVLSSHQKRKPAPSKKRSTK